MLYNGFWMAMLKSYSHEVMWVGELCEELNITEKEANRAISYTVGDIVDPVQQIINTDGRYVGVIEYKVFNEEGAYGYVDFDDVKGRRKRVVCARCVEQHKYDHNITHATQGEGSSDTDSDWQDLLNKVTSHYADSHSKPPKNIEPGASLVSGTTISGNISFHVGNDGPGSGLDADTVGGENADSLGTQYFIRGETADYVSDTTRDLPSATGSQDTALLLTPNEFFNRAVDVGTREGDIGVFTDPVSENLTDILPSTTGEGFLDIQFFKNGPSSSGEKQEVFLALNGNSQLKKFTLERLSDLTSNPTLQATADLTAQSSAPTGANATSFFHINIDNFDSVFSPTMLVGYDNGEIIQYTMNDDMITPDLNDSNLSIGGTPIDIFQRNLVISGETILAVTDNNEIEEYSYDGGLTNSTLNGTVASPESSAMQALELNGGATLHRVLADGRIMENEYKPGGDFGSPQIGSLSFGGTNPVFQTAISSPSTIELGRRPRRGSPFIIAGTSDTVTEQISTRRGGYQDDDYATQFAP